MEIAAYIAVGLLAVLFRYNLATANACKVIGLRLSENDTGTGFQDAITPPTSSNLTLITWALILAVFGYAAYQFGWSVLGYSVAVFFVISVVAGAVFVPKPESKHFVRKIYRSMAIRYANYEKQGDSARAAAIKELISRVEDKYQSQLSVS